MKRRRETVLQQRARFLFILGTTACNFASFRKGVAGPQRLHTLPVEEMKPRSQELAKTCGRAGQWAELCGFRHGLINSLENLFHLIPSQQIREGAWGETKVVSHPEFNPASLVRLAAMFLRPL